MNFARVIQTCEKHQILIRLTMMNDMHAIEFSTHVEDVGIVGLTHGFDTAEAAMAGFEVVTDDEAREMIADAIKDLKNEIAAEAQVEAEGEIKH